jgi:hypothetical protein
MESTVVSLLRQEPSARWALWLNPSATASTHSHKAVASGDVVSGVGRGAPDAGIVLTAVSRSWLWHVSTAGWPRQCLHQHGYAVVALYSEPLHKPAAPDNQRVVAHRVHRGLSEVSGDQEPCVAW